LLFLTSGTGILARSPRNNKAARPNSTTSPIVLGSYTNTDRLPPIETYGTPTEIPDNPDSTIRVNQTVINASLKGVASVFGEYMCHAIRRVIVQSDEKATVTMEFPDFVLVDCGMMLEVCE